MIHLNYYSQNLEDIRVQTPCSYFDTEFQVWLSCHSNSFGCLASKLFALVFDAVVHSQICIHKVQEIYLEFLLGYDATETNLR